MLSMSAPSNPTQTIVLPESNRQDFLTLAANVGASHRAIGRVVDDFVSEVPHGSQMSAYELYADLYYQATGERVSPRTIRGWRRAATLYSKHDLRQFESLTDAQLIEAVNLAEVANIDPQEICAWAIDKQVSTVPAMRAHWLPPTSDEYHVDPPVITGFKRWARRHVPEHMQAEFDDLLKTINEFVERITKCQQE